MCGIGSVAEARKIAASLVGMKELLTFSTLKQLTMKSSGSPAI